MINNNFKNKRHISEIINPWKEFENIELVQSSKISTIENYKKIIRYPLLPRFSFQRKSDIVVIGLSSFCKLSSQLQKTSHIVIRPKDLFKHKINIFKFLRNITFDLSIYKKIYKQIMKNEKYNYNYIEKILHKVKPSILIITSTIDPMQRLWAYYANKNKIKVVCIQHGLFSTINAPEALESNIVDYYFSYSEKQSRLIEKVIPKIKHQFLNTEHFFTYKIPKKKLFKVCLIGNDYERYGVQGKKKKTTTLKIYKRLLNILQHDNSREYDVFYKKHPSEQWIGEVSKKVSFIDRNKSDSIDIFFGVSSTLLSDLASERRCVIQITSKDLTMDRYEDYGICKTIDIDFLEKNGPKFLSQDKVTIPFLKSKNLSNMLVDILKDK